MILFPLLAAALTFTATATGVDKGGLVEFVFAETGTDHDYETMFVLDGSVTELCDRLEKAGLPRGKPADISRCRLWPVGCRIRFEPALERFVTGVPPEGLPDAVPIYTGGKRKGDGRCIADSVSPFAAFSTYTLDQAPIVYNGIFDQEVVYGSFTCATNLPKGAKVTFTLSWDDAARLPRHFDFILRKDNAATIIDRLHRESEKGEIEAQIDFDGDLTVAEATAFANALAVIDSVKVKINGCGNLYYRSFLPLVKWRDRQERLQQPFELTLNDDGTDTLLFIEEDWSGDGVDPKLTPHVISLSSVNQYTKTETCFIFANPQERIKRIVSALGRLKGAKLKSIYVFTQPATS